MNTNGVCDSSKETEAIQDFDYAGWSGIEQRRKGVLYSGCSCPLELKCRSENSCCPAGKWLPYVSNIESNREVDGGDKASVGEVQDDKE